MIPAAELTKPASRRLSATASAHLDLVRGVAATAVAFQHLRLFTMVEWPHATDRSLLIGAFYVLAKFAHPAVIVFFVLSGYLVGSSGVRSVQNRTWSLPRYLLHRFLRLEVVLLPALIIGSLWDIAGFHLFAASTIYQSWHLVTPVRLSWRVLLGNAFFLQDILSPTFGSNVALWSLSYEFWYYVLFGFIVAATVRGTRLWSRLLFAGAGFAAAWFMSSPMRLLAPLWFLGLGVYFLPQLKLSRRGSRILVLCAAFIFLVPLGFTFGLPARHWTIFHPLAIDLATGALFSFLLYALLHANPASTPYQKVAHRFAAPTYTLYANHVPVIVFFSSLAGSIHQPTPLACAEFVGEFVLLWLYAYGLYWLFESRTPQIRNWIESRLFPVAQT